MMNLLDLYVRVGARDEASPQIEEISNNLIGKLAGAATTAAKALAGAFAVKKAVDFGKAAFDAYSSFEQLEGGVAKLYGNANQSLDDYLKSMKDSGKSVDELTKTYQRNEEAQKLMMQQASDAWKTAGVDANTYMEQATSMSAALINSLGGDTLKAAEQTDVAMRAISDNVNTFGTDMESVSNAFMGFSKQNYTMLDNLKLGYGGTKEEMERLIADANEWGAANGKASDLSIDSFSDVVTAIEQIQEKQGIAGTTAKEAMSTIEGSMNATKAAWQNLVTEFGKPDADIGARVADMITALFGTGGEGGLIRNVTSEVRTIVGNVVSAIGNGLSQGLDWLVANGPTIAQNAISGIVSAMTSASSALGSFDLSQIFGGEEGSGIGEKISEMVSNIAATVREHAPEIQQAAGELINSIGQFITTNAPIIINSIGDILANIVNWIIENREQIFATIGEIFSNIVNLIVTYGPTILLNIATAVGMIAGYLIGAAGELILGFVNSLIEHRQDIMDFFMNLPSAILQALGDVGSLLVEAGRNLIQGFWNGLTEKFSEVKGWVSGVGAWIKEHKGPKQYDLGLLVDNGEWIMTGLQRGLENGLPSVQDTLSDITDSIQTGINASADVSVAQAPSGDAAILNALNAILNAIPDGVYLDKKTLVGNIAPSMNVAIGRL